jgi:hypothetical protein
VRSLNTAGRKFEPSFKNIFMPQDYERSKPRHDQKQQVNQSDPKNPQVNPGEDMMRSEETDALARRDPKQSHDYKGEAQNVNEDDGRPLHEDELEHARNKSTEGKDNDEDVDGRKS